MVSVMVRVLAVALIFGGAEALAASRCGGIYNSSERMALIKQNESRCGWPFKVDLVGLLCVPDNFRGGKGVYIITKGKSYPLNGNAKDGGPALGLKLGDIKEIAENDIKTSGWIKPGLDLCD